jgi:hypothetical protein
MNYWILPVALCIFCSCRQESTGQVSQGKQPEIIRASGKTIEQRFHPPSGYSRSLQEAGSFGDYLRTLPLKTHGSPVLYFDGREKPDRDVYAAVVKMDIGEKNLQQCADAVMRLRAEYLFKAGKAKKVHFNFTSGFKASYAFWSEGYRIKVNGNKVSWVASGKPGVNHASLREYLDVVFSYAGTLSLSKELEAVNYNELAIGDVLIQGGSPGHAVMVVDLAESIAGKKVYLLAQSYMPAQEIQILNNPVDNEISPWYELDAGRDMIQTPEWDFYSYNLKRFPKE